MDEPSQEHYDCMVRGGGEGEKRKEYGFITIRWQRNLLTLMNCGR